MSLHDMKAFPVARWRSAVDYGFVGHSPVGHRFDRQFPTDTWESFQVPDAPSGSTIYNPRGQHLLHAADLLTCAHHPR